MCVWIDEVVEESSAEYNGGIILEQDIEQTTADMSYHA